MVNMNIQQKFAEYPKGPKEKSKTTRLKKLNTNLDINGDINNKTAATIITIYDDDDNNNNNDSNVLHKIYLLHNSIIFNYFPLQYIIFPYLLYKG